MSGHLLSVADTCARLGMPASTFYARLKDGSLVRAGLKEATRLTRRRKFFADSVDRMLQPEQARKAAR
jgi:hypothetical protein